MSTVKTIAEELDYLVGSALTAHAFPAKKRERVEREIQRRKVILKQRIVNEGARQFDGGVELGRGRA